MKRTINNLALTVLAAAALLGTTLQSQAHCEIPCGIYTDKMRVEMLKEHFTTIEKSMKQIEAIGAEAKPNHNQLVRWVTNKDQHANEVQEIVKQYFMTQRVKPVEESAGKAYKDYVKKVTLLHQMLVSAMKCKQTTDTAHVAKLHALLADFEKAYF